jgi:hypothetical protein
MNSGTIVAIALLAGFVAGVVLLFLMRVCWSPSAVQARAARNNNIQLNNLNVAGANSHHVNVNNGTHATNNDFQDPFAAQLTAALNAAIDLEANRSTLLMQATKRLYSTTSRGSAPSFAMPHSQHATTETSASRGRTGGCEMREVRWTGRACDGSIEGR